MIPVRIAGTPEEWASLACALVVGAADRALAERDRFTLALSGGSTPAPFFRELARHNLAWDRVHIFQVDERVAADGDEARNLTGLRAALTEAVGLPEENLHPMPVTDPDLVEAAGRYAQILHEVCGDALDLVHLGLGDDGHTASWPPGDPVVDSTEEVAIVGPYRARTRMTLTPPVVNRAGAVLWLVSGPEKAEVLARLVSGDSGLPAARVRTDRAVVVADAWAATSLLPVGKTGAG